MNTAKSVFVAFAIAATAVAPYSVRAQSTADMASGEVRKVDKEAGKITIKHGELKSLGMPPMTMVFTVRDPAFLDQVKTGDKIRFQVILEGSKMVVTELQPAP